MSEGVSDSFAAISPAERCDLIRRLERPVENSRVAECRRRIRLRLLLAGVIVLIPWIVFLAFTLPASYIAHRWTATWVGFDMLLLTLLVATAVLSWLRRQLLVITAFTTGVLLICDAWFDVMTAGPDQMWVSVLSAVFLELPLAALLIGRALHIANAEAYAQLIASRARIVAAADEARRRIERDLHDGAQQRVVSLALELRAAEASVPSDLPALKSQISDLVSGLAGVSKELQDISRGIHPAIVSTGGVGPALKAAPAAPPSRSRARVGGEGERRSQRAMSSSSIPAAACTAESPPPMPAARLGPAGPPRAECVA